MIARTRTLRLQTFPIVCGKHESIWSVSRTRYEKSPTRNHVGWVYVERDSSTRGGAYHVGVRPVRQVEGAG
jgi:hypothetical protein